MVEGPGATRNHLKVKPHLQRTVLDLEFGKGKETFSSAANTSTANAANAHDCNARNVTSSLGEKGDKNEWWSNTILSQVIVIGKEVFLTFQERQTRTRRTLLEFPNDNVLYDEYPPPVNINDAASGAPPPKNVLVGNERAIRLHFGMNGSLKVTKLLHNGTCTLPTTRPKPTTTATATFRMILGPKITKGQPLGESATTATIPTILIESFQSTISGPMPASIPRTKYMNLSTCDVCSDDTIFSPNHVLEKIMHKQEQQHLDPSKAILVSDILLNQNVFPGVGNIIKVEALHHAKIHPKQPIASLTNENILRVISACRIYARQWYKDYHAPTKMVYNQTVCGTCQDFSICIQKVGQTNRTTFWCINCQPFQHPSSNSSSNPSMVVVSSSTSRTNPQLLSTITNKNQEGIPPLQQQQQGGNEKPMRMNPLQRAGVCKEHGPSGLVLKRVRVGGAGSAKNASRIFFTCTYKKCNHFAWADTHFPYCKCRNRTVLRISKTDRTGGRWFFSCRNRKVGGTGTGTVRSSECGHFEWATKTQLERLGSALNPLL